MVVWAVSRPSLKARPMTFRYRGEELSRVRAVLNLGGINLGGLVRVSQTVWRESYSYDRNGNRESKTTSWGTIKVTVNFTASGER
jgi:hypothetical protein